MAKPGKRTNSVILRAGMSIGTNAAEFDDNFLLPCFMHYPPVEICVNVQSSGMVLDGRTGSGKTAILKYIISKKPHVVEIHPSDMSMRYVPNSDTFNSLQSIGADLDLLF